MNITEQHGFENFVVAEKLRVREDFNFDLTSQALVYQFLKLVGHLALWGVLSNNVRKLDYNGCGH